jgi:hypothetical protein
VAAKLTWDAVCDIRKRAARGAKAKELAAEYAVSRNLVSQILAWKSWRTEP